MLIGFTNSITSDTEETNSATRSMINRWQPSLVGELMGPGTAITGRKIAAASRAVRSEPLLNAASTTTVALDSAAINRFLVKKRCGIAGTSGITSDINNPLSLISANNLSCVAG